MGHLLRDFDLGSHPHDIHFIHLLLDFFIMSTKLLALATDLADTNPAGAQLLVSLTSAETGAEIAEALDAYDSVVLETATEPVAV